MQTRRFSLIEACTNTATGFVISYAVTVIGYRMMGVNISASQNLAIVGILTVVSIARGYLLRRIFNRWR